MIDLKALAGDRYRITLDPSADIGIERSDRLWLYRIPCKYGFISVHGENMLAAFSDRPIIGKCLAAMPGVQVHQRGDREVRVLFSPERLDAIAGLLKAKRRVQLSDEEKTRRRERMLSLRNRAVIEAP